MITPDTHETDPRICEAIHWFADGDEDLAQRIWEDPTEIELAVVAERATDYGTIEPRELCWGENDLEYILADHGVIK